MNHQIFLTDDEFESSAEEDLLLAVRLLVSNERTRGACAACHGRCCKDIGCGFYSDRFDFCPIYQCRPAKCRVFFCSLILDDDSLDPTIVELLNKQVKVSEVIKPDFIDPILGDPALIQGVTGSTVEIEARSIVQAMERGELGLETTVGRLMDLVANHRQSSARRYSP